MPAQEKVTAVEEIKKGLEGARTVVLTEDRGLSVHQLSELRKQLRGAAARYTVVKNRLARIAVKASPLEGPGPHLTGPTGMVVSQEDPVAVAKALQAFTRVTPTLAIKVGYVEGQVLPAGELKTLADLPTKDALRGQVIGAIQGPLAQVLGLLTAPQRELVYVLAERGRAAAAAE